MEVQNKTKKKPPYTYKIRTSHYHCIFIENPGNEHVERSELERNLKDKIHLPKQIISHIQTASLQLQCEKVKIIVKIPVVETNRGGKFIDPFVVYVANDNNNGSPKTRLK